MAWIFQRRVDMDDLTDDLRIRIHYKLESGQLPYDSATMVSRPSRSTMNHPPLVSCP